MIAGPAVYGALGAALMCARSQLLTSLSMDVGADELECLSSFGIDLKRVTRSPLPSLVLDVDAVRERKPTAHVGNPLVWSGPPSFAFDPSDIVVAANGDPNWLMETLLRGAPGFLAVDLHVAWMRSRRSSLRYCVEAAHLVSGTVEEFNALAESNVRTRSECVRLVKRGPRGVVVTDKCTARSLPAPDLASPMKSDVGAGDFLLGLLVGSAARSGLIDRSSADHFAAAYQACRGHLSLLLDSADPAEFYQAVARSRRQAVH